MTHLVFNNFKAILFFSLILSSFNSMALIKLNIETLTKNYIDEGLVLSTEFNSSRVIEEGTDSVIRMGEKLEFKLSVRFEKDILNSGPSDLISLGGTLTYYGAFKEMIFDLERRKFRLGNKEAYYIQIDKDKKLEVYFKPSIKGFSNGS